MALTSIKLLEYHEQHPSTLEAKHHIRHLAPTWSGLSPGHCTWPLLSSSGASVGIYELTSTLYHP